MNLTALQEASTHNITQPVLNPAGCWAPSAPLEAAQCCGAQHLAGLRLELRMAVKHREENSEMCE